MLFCFKKSASETLTTPGINSADNVARANNAQYNDWESGLISILPLESTATPSEEEIYRQMDGQHCVKRLPTIAEQVADSRERSNSVAVQLLGNRALLSAQMDDPSLRQLEYIPERECLQRLQKELWECRRRVAEIDGVSRCLSEIAEDMNYIGQADNEAAAGIAAYWKQRLDTDQGFRLFVLAGDMKNVDAVYSAPPGKIKSDEFLMEEIIRNFSDEELRKYSDRLLIDERDLQEIPVDNVRVVMLDDWISTGTEMSARYHAFTSQYPELSSRMEVQLIVSNEERLAVGFHPEKINKEVPLVPTRAYFMANGRRFALHTYLAGSHSSDYTTVENVARLIDKVHYEQLPVGLQVARPYHRSDKPPVFYQRLRSSGHAA